jgi:glutaredoxin
VLRTEGHSERALFAIDKKGIIRYVDVHDIDEQPDNEELFRFLAALEPSVAPVERQYVTAPPAEPDADVVLYCTSWCPSCRSARAFFKDRGIEFVEVDITKNRAAAAKVKEWAGGFETTPTIKVKGQVVVGFDRSKLEELLKGWK